MNLEAGFALAKPIRKRNKISKEAVECKGLAEPLIFTPDFQLARYVAGRATRNERQVLESHCLECEFCCAVLGIVLRACYWGRDEDYLKECARQAASSDTQ